MGRSSSACRRLQRPSLAILAPAPAPPPPPSRSPPRSPPRTNVYVLEELDVPEFWKLFQQTVDAADKVSPLNAQK